IETGGPPWAGSTDPAAASGFSRNSDRLALERRAGTLRDPLARAVEPAEDAATVVEPLLDRLQLVADPHRVRAARVETATRRGVGEGRGRAGARRARRRTERARRQQQ